MKYKKAVLCLLFFCSGLIISHAQQGTMATGGDQSGGGGSVAYTVGQIVYTTVSANGSVAQGVQQPYEISVVTGTNESGNEITINSYPNPTDDYVSLKIEDYASEKLVYTLYDLNGKILVSREINSAQINISMCDYAAGTYYLKVTRNNEEVKQFKIIKNQSR